jgi:intracellular multiplication protein IcmJ
MYPIELNVNPEGWPHFVRRKMDPKFLSFREKVLQRDQSTCQYCGVTSKEGLEIVNRDQNYLNNKIDNFVTACEFCTQCFFLEVIGSGGYGGGTLIYLPEFTQNQLNAFCHVLFRSMGESEYKDTAQDTYRHLRLRCQVIEDEWGEGLQNPAVFGQSLVELMDKSILKKKMFSAVRLLPSRAAFTYYSEVPSTASATA